MPIFTRILDFKRTFLARLRNKRAHPRHRVGVGFPLKASLSLVGSERFNPDRAPGNVGLNWSGGVGNISCSGLSILLSPAATTARGESSRLRLTLENHEFAITCHVKHFRVHNSCAVCGVELEFDDFKIQKTYLQLVEAVAMGASFAPTGPARRQTDFLRRDWRSVHQARLTEWREVVGSKLDRFELTLGEHRVQGRVTPPGLEVHPRGDRTKSVPAATEAEVRQLFRWVAGNLPKSVPADLRECLARADSYRPAATSASDSPVTARAFTSTVIKTPPPGWKPPAARVGTDTVA